MLLTADEHAMTREIKVHERSRSGMLNDLNEFTEVGLDLARSSVKLLDETVGEAVTEL